MNYFWTIVLALVIYNVNAQSDGPRAHFPSPIGVWAVNVKYMKLDQNILPSGNLMLKNVKLNADVLPITLILVKLGFNSICIKDILKCHHSLTVYSYLYIKLQYKYSIVSDYTLV